MMDALVGIDRSGQMKSSGEKVETALSLAYQVGTDIYLARYTWYGKVY